VLEIATAIKDIGNKLFKEGRIEDALNKYLSEHELPGSSGIYIDVHNTESLRYLDSDVEETPAELKGSFDSLLAPLLLNSALAAIRKQPPSATTAVENASRALDDLELSKADKGKYDFLALRGDA
jgi:peptidyl-prolyl isomerase D